MSFYIDPETGWPECERCAARWYALNAKPANPSAWFEQMHIAEGHR